MYLQSSRKIYGKGVHRTVKPAETLRRIKQLMPLVGVTRLADITGLDRLDIPTYSAVVPKSDDILSVYNGKGATKIDAKVGAVMEAIERHSALAPDKEVISGSYNELQQHRKVFDPRCMGLKLHSQYTYDTEIAWVEGFDLLQQEPILVPIDIAGYLVQGKYGSVCSLVSTTNGLASGNTLEEAICHALCELIERDAWTIAELLSHWQPYALYTQQIEKDAIKAKFGFQDDIELYSMVELSHANDVIKGLLDKFYRAGLPPTVKNITSDLGIPTVMAVVGEMAGPSLPRSHLGIGTHPDVQVAAARALTEVAQSRVVDIQGVREDISLSDDEQHRYMPHTKRVEKIDKHSWYHGQSSVKQHLSDIPSYTNSDILDDIHLMLSHIQKGGMQQVVVVDLTKQTLAVPVVRVLVPGLESWTADRKQIGWRATMHWRANNKRRPQETVVSAG